MTLMEALGAGVFFFLRMLTGASGRLTVTTPASTEVATEHHDLPWLRETWRARHPVPDATLSSPFPSRSAG